MLAIEAESLSKSYGGSEAVRGVDLKVVGGEIFGFLGPNGAGKTTTIKMLTTLIPPSSGRARVLGCDIVTEGKKLRPRIGVVQQGESCEYSKTVAEALDIYGLLWDIPKRARGERAEGLLEAFQLQSHRDKLVSELSAGLRRRLQVAREFMHDMDLLFLDEPTVGLDPIARLSILEMIRERARRGLTVFLTTQALDEAERLCDRIAIIHEGTVVTTDTPRGLKDRFGGVKTIEVSVDEGDSGSLVSGLQGVRGVSAAVAAAEPNGIVTVWTTDPGEAFNAIIRLGDELCLRLGSVTLREPSLEQAFINLIQGGDAPG